ncbi:MAG TPA: response regulator [Desulfobacteraceae bacterium]|nr:response regulator [Deltaproteobacteria bacterium]HDM10694.1 response regulator [Desulfobacteraceae bacterium]
MMKILVVDDEEQICELLDKFLSQEGYQVITAATGEEALEKLEEESPQLVLLDIRMPGMGGIECLRKIKEKDEKIGVIMTTAVGDTDTIKEAISLGVNDYILKPIDLDYLGKLIISWKQVFLDN